MQFLLNLAMVMTSDVCDMALSGHHEETTIFQKKRFVQISMEDST